MIYSIQVIGSDILRKECENLPLEKTPELSKLILDMFETMHTSDGVGLAAPQIGKSLKLFVIDAAPFSEDESELADFKHTFINAKIIEYSGEKTTFNEGCLSIPHIREDVIRYNKIHIQYYDENLEYHDEIFEGTKARIIQHEYDHTCGILFVDRLPKVKQTLLRNKLKAIAAGKFESDYRTLLGDKSRRDLLLLRIVEKT